MCWHPLSTGYFPDPSAMEGGFLDAHGHPLNTLQDVVNGYSADDRFGRFGHPNYVSAAMDADSDLQGKTVHALEIDREYGRVIPIRICDTGGAFVGKKNTRIDICTRDEKASEADLVNGYLTLNLLEAQS